LLLAGDAPQALAPDNRAIAVGRDADRGLGRSENTKRGAGRAVVGFDRALAMGAVSWGARGHDAICIA